MLSIRTLLVFLVVATAFAAGDDRLPPYRKDELPPYRSSQHRASTYEDEFSQNRRDTYRRYHSSTTTTTVPPVSQKEYDDVKGLLDRVEDELAALKTNMGNLTRCVSNSNDLRNTYDGHKRDYEELKRENAREIQKSVTQFNSIVELKMTIKNLEHQLDAERNSLTSNLQICDDAKKEFSDLLETAEEENKQFRIADAFQTEDCQMLNDTLIEIKQQMSDSAISEDFQKCLDTVADLEESNTDLNNTQQICQKSLTVATDRCSAAQVDLIQNSFASTNIFLYCVIAIETAFLFIIMVAVKVHLCKKGRKAEAVVSIDDGLQELQMDEMVRYRQ